MEDITVLFVGDDWAEDHHDVEVQDETGRRLAKARLPEGIAGIARLHAMVGRFLPEDGDAAEVKIGIETDRGPWVGALIASGYQVYAVNPLQSARARQGQDVSGAKSDAGDAHVLADLVRTHSHQLRTVAGDSKQAGAVKVLTRMHQTLIWHLTQPPVIAAAYGATVRALAALIATSNEQITALEGPVEACFGQHPDAEIYLSQPGLGPILGARVLAEFGDDPTRYEGARARKNYAGTSPITRASGKKKVVLARYVRNKRLADAVHRQAFCALSGSPGARAYYDALRDRDISYNAALRQLGNRLVGILHGCLKTRTCYDEATAWDPHTQRVAA